MKALTRVEVASAASHLGRGRGESMARKLESWSSWTDYSHTWLTKIDHTIR